MPQLNAFPELIFAIWMVLFTYNLVDLFILE